VGEWLFGPLFGPELRRLARGPWPARLRATTAAAMLLAVAAGWWAWCVGQNIEPVGAFLDGRGITLREQARFATRLVASLLVGQGVVLLVTAVACSAGAIYAERRAGTLDLLLTTHLTGHEIVRGKLGARLVLLANGLLAGLPVAMATLVWGGIDIRLVLATFAWVGLLTATAAGVTVAASAAADTWAETWTVPACFVAILGLIGLLIAWWLTGEPLTLIAAVPFGLVFALLGSSAVSRAGWSAGTLRQRPVAPPPSPVWPLPPLGDRALWWRETARLRSGSAAADLGGMFVAATVPSALLGVVLLRPSGDAWSNVGSVVTAATLFYGGLAVLGAAAAAVGTVSDERAARSLEALLTLPVPRREILRTKLLAALWRGRWLAGLLTVVWLGAVAAGGLHPVAPVLLAAGVGATVLLAATLGLALSVACPTTARAQVFLALVGVAVPMLTARVVGALFEMPDTSPLVPPFSWLALRLSEPGAPLSAALAGVAVQAALAACLWGWAAWRFEQEGRRG
jgi:ABC-type transport system involved in multi-copper enzyme maturation permease subunit